MEVNDEDIYRGAKALSTALLATYVVELLFNRILIRIWIFIPSSSVTRLLAEIVSKTGLFALNLSVVLGLVILGLIAAIRRDIVAAIIAMATLVLSIADYLGVIRLSWALFLVAGLILVRDKRRVAEATALAVLALTSFTSSLLVAYLSQILWLLAPIPLVTRKRVKGLRWSIPISVLVAGLILLNTYAASQILTFGMGILNPWFLVAGLIAYSLAGRPGLYGLFLTGPRLQLSNQIITLVALYLVEMNKARRVVEP